MFFWSFLRSRRLNSLPNRLSLLYLKISFKIDFYFDRSEPWIWVHQMVHHAPTRSAKPEHCEVWVIQVGLRGLLVWGSNSVGIPYFSEWIRKRSVPVNLHLGLNCYTLSCLTDILIHFLFGKVWLRSREKFAPTFYGSLGSKFWVQN